MIVSLFMRSKLGDEFILRVNSDLIKNAPTIIYNGTMYRYNGMVGMLKFKFTECPASVQISQSDLK